MPGPNEEKNMRMANMACQTFWGRDYSDAMGDRLTTFGGYFLYNQRCWLIVDNGPVNSAEYTTVTFNWDPKKQELYALQYTCVLC
jgi:hypothetical protein